MKYRNKYDTTLIWLYSEGKEHLVPQQLKSGIPASTISTWKNSDYAGYYGHEMRLVQDQAFEYYELLEKYRSLKKTVFVLARIWVGISGFVLPVLQKRKDLEEEFINFIQHLFTVFPKKMALKIAGISQASFYEKIARLKFKCGESPTELCIQRNPMQLCIAEVQKIKDLFSDMDMTCWPASSLYYEGIRNRGLFISLSTFYKYVNILGFKRKWKKRIHKSEGLRAKRPNEYLHVDTTLWELENGKKMAIAFVSDNFSRAILGWNTSLKNGADNILPALKKTIDMIRSNYPALVEATLVADGGSENHADSVEVQLRETKIPAITKVIAQRDIRFSNSPVEAVNKIVKRYLRFYKPSTYDDVVKCLELIEKDYNYKRPHGSLTGLTPMEAYKEPEKSLDFTAEKRAAKGLRIVQNQKINCLPAKQAGVTCRK